MDLMKAPDNHFNISKIENVASFIFYHDLKISNVSQLQILSEKHLLGGSRPQEICPGKNSSSWAFLWSQNLSTVDLTAVDSKLQEEVSSEKWDKQLSEKNRPNAEWRAASVTYQGILRFWSGEWYKSTHYMLKSPILLEGQLKHSTVILVCPMLPKARSRSNTQNPYSEGHIHIQVALRRWGLPTWKQKITTKEKEGNSPCF